MNSKTLSIGELFKFGYETFKNNWQYFVGILLLAFFTVFIPSLLADFWQQNNLISIPLKVLSYLLHLLVSMGLVKIALKFSNGETPAYSDLYSCAPRIVPYFFGQLIYGIGFLIALLLLIFPALIWASRYNLYQYFIIDKNQGALESFHSSAEATKGARWDYAGFLLMCAFLIAGGILCLVIGLFVAIPVVMVANALAYRKLLAQSTPASR